MKKTAFNKPFARIVAAGLAAILLASSFSVPASAEDASSGRLMNGSFEEHTWNGQSTSYGDDFYWKTTSTDRRIEIFTQNWYYTPDGAMLIGTNPVDWGANPHGAELNAEQEASLYQIIDTEPSSIYQWGLDHAARTAYDTMALIIGPEQPVAPSKPNSSGRDQMMQMVDWLKANGTIGDTSTSEGLENGGTAIVVYSKPFSTNGTFANDADHNPFSMTPSSVYTEKWCIWVITDQYKTVQVPGWQEGSMMIKWSSYGANAASTTRSLNLDDYFLYNVPTGQNRTLFSFTSVNVAPKPNGTMDLTFGNFLDNINFTLYHRLTTGFTIHGNAVVATSDGSEATADQTAAGDSSYFQDGSQLLVKGIVKAADISTVKFLGFYYTVPGTDGSSSRTFVPCNGTGWTEEVDPDTGDVIYTYPLPNMTTAIDVQFVFVKSPMLTYDVNGGKPYMCLPTGSNSATEADNVYNYQPTGSDSGTIYIDPYTSHAPEGQNDGWKFLGWQLYDDNGVVSDLFPAVHSVACNYQQPADGGVALNQNFVIIDPADNEFQTPVQTELGKTWDTAADPMYETVASGLTMVAQWRWRQQFVPQAIESVTAGPVNSTDGGTVNITSVADQTAANENYDASDANGARIYYADTNEVICAEATANDGYFFAGWYDADGNLVSTGTALQYTEQKGITSLYYARFVKLTTNTFVRQIKDGDTWTSLTDDDTSKMAVLSTTSVTGALGETISSTATGNDDYIFIGWFDENGSAVSADAVTNDGKTLSLAAPDGQTFYARYRTNEERTYTINHWFENLSGTEGQLYDGSYYTNVESITDIATPDETVLPTTTSLLDSTPGYTYYTGIPEAAVSITEDGTVFDIYYKLNTYEVTFNAGDHGSIGDDQADISSTEKHGAEFPSVPATSPDDHFEFDYWQDAEGNKVTEFPETVTEDATYTAVWKQVSADPGVIVPGGAYYRVEHYLEQLDGSYALEETEYFVDAVDAEVTAVARTYTGYTEDTANADRVASGTVILPYSDDSSDNSGSDSSLDGSGSSIDDGIGSNSIESSAVENAIVEGVTDDSANDGGNIDDANGIDNGIDGNSVDNGNDSTGIDDGTDGNSVDNGIDANSIDNGIDASSVDDSANINGIDNANINSIDNGIDANSVDNSNNAGNTGNVINSNNANDNSSDSGYVTVSSDEPNMLTLRLYYKLNTYEVTFNAGDHGSIGDARTTVDYSGKHGSEFPAVPATSPADGFEFDYWQDDDGNRVTEFPETLTGDAVYTAIWKEIPEETTPADPGSDGQNGGGNDPGTPDNSGQNGGNAAAGAGTNAGVSGPATGDNSRPAFWLVLAGASLLTIVVLSGSSISVKRRRHNR